MLALPAPGTHAVQTKTYAVPSLTATGGTKTAKVFAPKDPPSSRRPTLYPFISFAHGIIDASYDALLTDLAAYGFVVSNMKTCAGVPVCALAPYTADQLSMLDFAEAQRAAGDALFAPTWGWRATRTAAWPRRPTRAATTGACAPRGRSTRARAP